MRKDLQEKHPNCVGAKPENYKLIINILNLILISYKIL